jgi:hypothetical protein
MADRDKQVNRAREALQEKQEEDRLRAETEEPERSQEAPEPRPPNEDEGDSKKR